MKRDWISNVGKILTDVLALLIESNKIVTAELSFAISSNCCVRPLTATNKSLAASSNAGWWFTA